MTTTARELFEKAYWQRFFSPEKWAERTDYFCRTDDDKYYLNDEVEDAWHLWQVAEARGRESVLSETPHAPKWIKHEPQEPVFEGSIFAVATQVKNEKEKTTRWEIATITVGFDELGRMDLTNWVEDDSGDSYTSWSWEDFEYVYPLNEDADNTVSEWNLAKLKEPT